MTLLCDEGVDRPIVESLRQAGYQVVYVAEMAPGISDELVLAEANRAGALLVTLDKDFGELVFRQQLITAGVVLVRLAGLSQAQKSGALLSALGTHGHELLGAFSVISPGQVRIRKQA